MRPTLFLAVSLVSVGCGGTTDPGGDGSDFPDMFDCAHDTRGETYVDGFEKPSSDGTLDFTLVHANPAPPSRGDNTWVLQVNAMTAGVVGEPMDGIEAMIKVKPFMPDHQHGSPIATAVTPVDGQPGQYTLDPVNLWMPGVWETTLSVGDSKVKYTFCLSE